MKATTRLVSIVIAALVSLQAAAFAQTDVTAYNTLYAQKASLLTSVQSSLSSADANRANKAAQLTFDQQTVAYYTTVVASDNSAVQSSQSQLNSLLGEAQTDYDAIAGDEEVIAYLWELYDYYSEVDPEDGFMLYDIEMEVDLMSEDEAQYYADLSFLEPEIDAAESQYDASVSAQGYDQQALSAAQSAVTTDQTNLATAQSQVSNLEAIRDTTTAWLNNNPTYSAWVANGYPG